MKREALAVSKKIAVATIVNAANNFIDLIMPGGVSRFRQSDCDDIDSRRGRFARAVAAQPVAKHSRKGLGSK